jgi:hypothetical protein
VSEIIEDLWETRTGEPIVFRLAVNPLHEDEWLVLATYGDVSARGGAERNNWGEDARRYFVKLIAEKVAASRRATKRCPSCGQYEFMQDWNPSTKAKIAAEQREDELFREFGIEPPRRLKKGRK